MERGTVGVGQTSSHGESGKRKVRPGPFVIQVRKRERYRAPREEPQANQSGNSPGGYNIKHQHKTKPKGTKQDASYPNRRKHSATAGRLIHTQPVVWDSPCVSKRTEFERKELNRGRTVWRNAFSIFGPKGLRRISVEVK